MAKSTMAIRAEKLAKSEARSALHKVGGKKIVLSQRQLEDMIQHYWTWGYTAAGIDWAARR